MLNQRRIGSSLLNLHVAATALSGLAPSGRALASSALSSLSDTPMHTPKKATHSAYRSAEMKCLRRANSTPTGPTTASSCHPGHSASYPHEFLGMGIFRSDAHAGPETLASTRQHPRDEFSRLFLGGLLSSRARLCFTGRIYSQPIRKPWFALNGESENRY